MAIILNQAKTMSTLEQHYRAVRQRLQAACEQSGRSLDQVRLLAVSKTKPPEMVAAVYALGQRSFGENYLQDGLDKISALGHLSDIEWHFIGPLQSNKTRGVAEHFHWVETVDRYKIAQRLNDQRPKEQPKLNILVQVNISREPQKNGIMPEDVLVFCQTLHNLERLTLRGLMCIAEATTDQARLREQFEQMQQLFQTLQQQHPNIDTLSMGMSGDLELAVACGSTELRIGTDIFGHRNATAS